MITDISGVGALFSDVALFTRTSLDLTFGLDLLVDRSRFLNGPGLLDLCLDLDLPKQCFPKCPILSHLLHLTSFAGHTECDLEFPHAVHFCGAGLFWRQLVIF